ncbi:MAG: hypothetical protein ABIA75_01775 [Candidatus Neomarinimicrobiota bacterium]
MGSEQNKAAKKNQIVKSVEASGSLMKAAQVSEIGQSTLEEWRRKDEEFNATLERAMKNHHDRQIEKLATIAEKLIDVAGEALEEKKYQVKTTSRETIFNRRDEITGYREWETVKEKIREPNILAVLKILTEINNSLLGQYSFMLNNDRTIREQLVGPSGSSFNTDETPMWILSEKIDLNRIRWMQAQTQSLYDKGLITDNEYRKRTIEEIKLSQEVLSHIETRTKAEFQGKTLFDVRNDVHAILNLHHNLIRQAIGNTNVKREGIFTEFQKLLKEHLEND